MSKRTTVMRMLRKRLCESKHSISVSHQYEDMVNVMGGDNSKEDQHRKNMERDIYELEYLIECLSKKRIEDTASILVALGTPETCKCIGGAKGRTVTEDFEHQVCEQCGLISK